MNRQWHDVEQNTEAWVQLRIGKATGSNAGCYMANGDAAFGEPAKKYALQVALEIATGRKAEFSFSSDHTERGHEQEPIARMYYEDAEFVTVTNGGFFDCGGHGDSPDGLIGTDGVIEIKCVTAAVHYATLKRGSFDPAYRWQLVSHLDCTGRDWVDFVSFCSEFPEASQLIVYRSTRDDFKEELKKLAERRAKFLELVQSTLSSIPR
ncbi:YqaJ viral recombinase family protein [Pseudomonas sp. SMN5]|uniref:YqaJ viral recombinase family protein n=1 Tax=Pseudomonas sp. SMN5 TaxID=3390198 RepID=UPI003F83821F